MELPGDRDQDMTTSLIAPRRPLIRYLGGKWVLSRWIIPLLPPHRVYVEPFGGGASVLLRKERSGVEVYNDADGELVNLFRCVRDHGAALIEKLENTPFSREEFRRSYRPTDDGMEQARRTVVRTFQGFCSTSYVRQTAFRASSKGRNGEHVREWVSLPQALGAIITRLRQVIIEQRPAADVIRNHDAPDALFFLDPPYVASTRDKGSIYRADMDDAGHEALAEQVHGLAGAAVVCGYPSALYDRLYAGWTRHTKPTRTHGNARQECLWVKPG